jgi:hypothetical protein
MLSRYCKMIYNTLYSKASMLLQAVVNQDQHIWLVMFRKEEEVICLQVGLLCDVLSYKQTISLTCVFVYINFISSCHHNTALHLRIMVFLLI